HLHSTPSPYTTLFRPVVCVCARSDGHREQCGNDGGVDEPKPPAAGRRIQHAITSLFHYNPNCSTARRGHSGAVSKPPRDVFLGRDRKSTRLNSSHGSI